MQNEKLLFENNYNELFEQRIRKGLKFSKEKRFSYRISTDVFTGDHILEILSVIAFIMKTYNQKIPITFLVSRCGFFDKLASCIIQSVDETSSSGY